MSNLIVRIITSLIIVALAIVVLVELPQATVIARLGQGYLMAALLMAGVVFAANKRWQVLGLGVTGVFIPVIFLI